MSDAQEIVSTALTPTTIAGAIAFAAVKLGPPLKTIIQLLYAIWEQREVELEKDDRRARKRRRIESTQPPTRGSRMPTVDSVPIHVPEESTDVIDCREAVRKRAPKGFRAPTRGEHHDGKEG